MIKCRDKVLGIKIVWNSSCITVQTNLVGQDEYKMSIRKVLLYHFLMSFTHYGKGGGVNGGVKHVFIYMQVANFLLY